MVNILSPAEVSYSTLTEISVVWRWQEKHPVKWLFLRFFMINNLAITELHLMIPYLINGFNTHELHIK